MYGPQSELGGNPEWWPNGVPEELESMELNPPIILENWRRQRLRPLLHKWLYPCVWSMLLLAMGLIAILLDSRIDMHPAIAAIILLSAPSLLGISLLTLLAQRRAAEPLQTLIRGLLNRSRFILFVAMLIMFFAGLAQNIPVESNYWMLLAIPTVLLWFEWWVFGTFVLSIPSARWIRPISEGSVLPIDEMISAGWKWVCERTTASPGSIAVHRCPQGSILELSVERFYNDSWLVLSWWPPYGVRHDPFIDSTNSGSSLPSLFALLGHSTFELPEHLLEGLDSSYIDSSNA